MLDVVLDATSMESNSRVMVKLLLVSPFILFDDNFGYISVPLFTYLNLEGAVRLSFLTTSRLLCCISLLGLLFLFVLLTF